MSKVLVIHPDDRSTDFLKLIYEDKGYDVITDCKIDRTELARQVDLHDKIIMLGHGTPTGLMNPDYFSAPLFSMQLRPFIIDNSFIELFRDKETISIWCNSDKFFRPAGLKGLHTGMVISETGEQQFVLGRVYLNAEEQLENMIRFSKAFGECIEMSPKDMQNYMMEHYTGDDPVTQFNRNNIIVL